MTISRNKKHISKHFAIIAIKREKEGKLDHIALNFKYIILHIHFDISISIFFNF
jgi:hypothetical protein